MSKAIVVVPNWNGRDRLAACLDSLLSQSFETHIIVVDNGSDDGSAEFIEQKYPSVEMIKHSKNKGYAGGVNPGFKRAIEMHADYVAAFNNDAAADKDWLKHLVEALDKQPGVGIAACKLMSADGKKLDSTGDYYTSWGLPYPRGRGEININKYDDQRDVFGASGGASLYRVSMLEQVGLFDEDFFAYYEDVDLSFRAQLAGWKVTYIPSSKAYHQIGATSSQIKGFATYQTLKNLPLLLWKNVPWSLMPRVYPRFVLSWSAIALRTVSRGQIGVLIKACVVGGLLWFKILLKRHRIQSGRKVTDSYIWSMLVHDLPPNAHALRRLRALWQPKRT